MGQFHWYLMMKRKHLSCTYKPRLSMIWQRQLRRWPNPRKGRWSNINRTKSDPICWRKGRPFFPFQKFLKWCNIGLALVRLTLSVGYLCLEDDGLPIHQACPCQIKGVHFRHWNCSRSENWRALLDPNHCLHWPPRCHDPLRILKMKAVSIRASWKSVTLVFVSFCESQWHWHTPSILWQRWPSRRT